MHDQVLKSTMIAAVLLAAGAAEAQDTRCGGGYRTMAGQQTQAWLDTRAGKPCHMTYVTFGNSRGSSGISVVSAPKNGSVSTSGTGFRYAPRAGFHGTDHMTLRFGWNGPPSNKPSSGTVVFNVRVE
ncbi:MAG: Ig-like domain-containing protein [Xanthobacteraceae bacterium]